MMGLLAKADRKYKVTADSAHSLPIAPCLLEQDLSYDASAESASHTKAPDCWLVDCAARAARDGAGRIQHGLYETSSTVGGAHPLF